MVVTMVVTVAMEAVKCMQCRLLYLLLQLCPPCFVEQEHVVVANFISEQVCN